MFDRHTVRRPSDEATDAVVRSFNSHPMYLAPTNLTSIGTVGRCRVCQTGTIYQDRLQACVATTDGNIVVAGLSQGSVDGTASPGYHDIVAVKLNVSNGEELWTYQVRRTTHS